MIEKKHSVAKAEEPEFSGDTELVKDVVCNLLDNLNSALSITLPLVVWFTLPCWNLQNTKEFLHTLRNLNLGTVRNKFGGCSPFADVVLE